MTALVGPSGRAVSVAGLAGMPGTQTKKWKCQEMVRTGSAEDGAAAIVQTLGAWQGTGNQKAEATWERGQLQSPPHFGEEKGSAATERSCRVKPVQHSPHCHVAVAVEGHIPNDSRGPGADMSPQLGSARSCSGSAQLSKSVSEQLAGGLPHEQQGQVEAEPALVKGL